MRARYGALMLAGLLWAAAATAAPQVPIGAADRAFVRGLYANWYQPGAVAFGQQAHALTGAMQALCDAPKEDAAAAAALAAARRQWQVTVDAWERFSAVRGGALLSRRSPREIDFMPTRPEAIRRAIDADHGDKAMELVGAPAKGLPALEWLLWTQAAAPHSPACRYAVRLTHDVAAEAEALRAAYARSLEHGWDDEETEYALYEFLNLFDAGIQKLWWEDMDRPQVKATGSTRGASFSRAASASTVLAWRAHWQGLRALAVGVPDHKDAPSLHAYLLAKGHGVAATGLTHLVAEVDRAMDAIETGSDRTVAPVKVSQAVAALKALQQHIEADTAHALQYVISFFDEDGD